MKKLLLPLLACGMFVSAFSQSEPQEPCCSIIATNIKNNLVVARDNTTGRLYQFKADAMDMRSIRKGDAATIDIASKKITAISGAVRNYPVIQPDKAEPVGILAVLRIDNAEPITEIVTPKINNATPISDIISIQVDNVEPINDIVTPKINNAEPVGKPTINNAEPINTITAKNKLTGKTFQFKVPASIAKTLKVGDPVYAQPVNDIRINYAGPINGFAIVQSSYGSSNGQMASYGYPATSADETTGNTNEAEKWVITPVTTMKGVLGRLDINYPAGVDRWILYYQPADNKYMGSVSEYDKFFTISPGEYRFLITDVPVENVPIQKGHETRIKMGFLNVVSEGGFYLYNDTKEKLYTTYDKPKKIALPVGSYQLSLGGQFYPFVIKDGETVEY